MMFEVEGKLFAKAMQLSTSETNILPKKKHGGKVEVGGRFNF